MNSDNITLAQRTLTQITDKSGDTYKCYATENLWVGYGEQFAFPTGGNEVTPLTSGKQYFEELIKAIRAASKEIYIAGWQINWDALLAPKLRLFDLLLEAAGNGCNIYVMPWDDNAPVQTYDDQTRSVLLSINGIVKQKRVQVLLSGATADKSNSFFSHHQKQVVIDRQIAFIGGIDVAYGRYDDDSFNLRADAEGRVALNRYNGCVVPAGSLDPALVVDPDHLTGVVDWINKSGKLLSRIRDGAHQGPYAEDSVVSPIAPGIVYETLDPSVQPRMPWQDVQVMIQGPAVVALTRNFVFRWNIGVPGVSRLAIPPAPEKKSDGCHVQVLRSAPAAMRHTEYKMLPSTEQKNFSKPSGLQNDIVRAMAILIDKAQHFIYIENQFFVSAFGTGTHGGGGLSGPAQIISQKDGTGAGLSTWVPGPSKQLPQNDICFLLAGRIGRAILDPTNPSFHVYITLPVYSEGRLDSGPIVTQIHWTMQSLVFGSMSLLNRIRRFIKARELHDQKDADWGRALLQDSEEYKSVPKEKCFKYVTLLNLRNWDKIGERYVTEQIYVHSKLMIVDDRFAIVGSANINDRSLLGSRDSELAVLMMDTEIEKADICGDGKMRPVRGVARRLRQAIWKKIFGITGGIRPATELQAVIDKPADPKSWAAIQKVAKENAKLFETAFDWVPRNSSLDAAGKKRTSSIWPTWDPTIPNKDGSLGAKISPMPFDKVFWAAPQHTAAAAKLTQVKGYITLLPIDWTMGENNNIGYHTALVTENKQTVPTVPPAILGQVSTDRGSV